jgi:hypothetical protein
MKIYHAAGAFALSGLLAACGGAQTTTPLANGATPAPGTTPTSTPLGAPTPTPPPPGVTSSQFVISLAGGTGATIQSARRNPKFVSPSTQSVTFTVDGGAAVTQNLTATATNCSASNGGVQCAVPLAGVAGGNHMLAVTAWSGAGGTGSKLGANSAIAFTVVANQANVVSGIIGGIATSIALVPANTLASGSFTTGFTLLYQGQPEGFTAEPIDAAGNVIIGPGAPSIAPASVSGITTAAGTLPNTFTISVLPAQVAGPAKMNVGTLQLALTPAASSGGTPITVTTAIFVREPTLYALYDNGTVVAYDALGHQEPHPNAADAINASNNLGIAYAPQGTSLVAYTASNVDTYNSVGANLSNQLSLGAVSLAPTAFTWFTDSNTGYGFDTVSQKVVQIGPGANPTTITALGAAQGAPFVAIMGDQKPFQLPVETTSDALFAATSNNVESIAVDVSASGLFTAPSVGAINSLAFDPVQRNLFVAGASGVAVYRNGSLTPTTLPGLTGESGIAFNPESGFVYVANFSSHNIYAIDANGAVQFDFPMSAVGNAVQLVFAP